MLYFANPGQLQQPGQQQANVFLYFSQGKIGHDSAAALSQTVITMSILGPVLNSLHDFE